ncbi:glutathione S-transferase Mu 1-like [Glandiceps talaboti]
MSMLLGYWNIRGLGQAIRLVLEYTGVDYTEKRYDYGPAPDYSKDAWLNEKYNLGLDFPNLPYLIDGDVKLTQTHAILVYLARKTNLLGTNENEMRRADLVYGRWGDFRMLMGGYFTDPDWESAEKREEFLKKLKVTLEELSSFLGDNPWFAGDNITYPDFMLYEYFARIRQFDDKQLPSNVKVFLDRVEALPAIAKYMKSDQFIKCPIYSMNVKFGRE